MHFCDDQVFFWNNVGSKREKTLAPLFLLTVLICLIFVKIILNIIKVSDNVKSIVILP